MSEPIWKRPTCAAEVGPLRRSGLHLKGLFAKSNGRGRYVAMEDRVRLALSELKNGRTLDEVARQFGYKNRNSLTQLLRRSGYRWDKVKKAYVPANGEAEEEPAKKDEDLSPEARELLSRAPEVLKLLNFFVPCGGMAEPLSSPLLRGVEVVKSLRLPHPLVEEVERFAKERMVSQKRVFECALVEFLARRGGDGDASFGGA